MFPFAGRSDGFSARGVAGFQPALFPQLRIATRLKIQPYSRLERRYAIMATVAISCFALLVIHGRAADNYPASDPPLTGLSEPGQSQDPAVYRARREALMKSMGEGV